MTVDAETDADTAAHEVADTSSDADYDNEAGATAEIESSSGSATRPQHRLRRLSPRTQALVTGVVLIAVLSAIAGRLGWQNYQSHGAEQVRAQLLQGGRQGALNLTTIDWQRVDNDTKRILASSTGTFRDEFAQRLKPFTDVVRQAQSKSEGTITAASLESSSGDEARVLVALNVRISNAGTAEDTPRVWRMRISVQKTGGAVKMSHVEFVP
jgi:Mce-associated membrane protein